MTATQLRSLTADLPKDRHDTGAITDYRAVCGRVYLAALQAATSGAFGVHFINGFPSLAHAVRRKAFARMGLAQLRNWANQFRAWLAKMPSDERDRLLAGDVL